MSTDNIARSAEARRIIDLVGRGVATSRSELAAALGLAPSTVGLRVQTLLDVGLLREGGAGASRGGRRPRVLRVDDAGGEVLTVEVGGAHARIGRHSLTGSLLAAQSFPIQLSDGPRTVLDVVIEHLRAAGADRPVRAIGVSLPGPVDTSTGSVDQPSRMPGWPGFRVGEHLSAALGVPTFVDNDANLAALGEHRARFGSTRHSITVKAGTAIGSGIVVDGRIHRGATAAAGDISHTRIDSASAVPCSCGNVGCLETVASGAGLVRQLRERGIEVADTEDVLQRARDADPAATSLVRMAGTHLGQVLSGVVNFFNPHAVFLTGSLSASEPFLAAVRSRVYEACHPLVTQTLTIEAAQTGPDAILLGAARLAIDELPVAAS
ncbi:ROK family transcriptional regulator [Microbacterium horticulturae]|uniref:ROK family transcriptional regulator n=1 Tax=Microbacterium horticulturae TaxID=3028316 RepID=A0ABY8BTC8_9MICO|nr:ROK family transcriptional regulator [Microbacterium sp. KACC 23027]WEG07429.1 ROK family transcriptional regulator [Microbacterium sp. KACC 23027]